MIDFRFRYCRISSGQSFFPFFCHFLPPLKSEVFCFCCAEEALLFCLRSLLCFCLSVLALEISKTVNAANKEMRVSHKEMFRNKMLIYTITRFLQYVTQFSQKRQPAANSFLPQAVSLNLTESLRWKRSHLYRRDRNLSRCVSGSGSLHRPCRNARSSRRPTQSCP